MTSNAFPSSPYQLIGDDFCSASASGGLRIRAEQLGHRFPDLRYHSFSLAGFEPQAPTVAKSRKLFLGGRESPFTRSCAVFGPLRLLRWHKQDYEGVRKDLESELDLVPLGSRRELQLELALLDEFLVGSNVPNFIIEQYLRPREVGCPQPMV